MHGYDKVSKKTSHLIKKGKEYNVKGNGQLNYFSSLATTGGHVSYQWWLQL